MAVGCNSLMRCLSSEADGTYRVDPNDVIVLCLSHSHHFITGI